MKENKAPQYNIRLNLNNPYHLKLHNHLKDIKGDVYKSKNDYMVSKLYEGIFGSIDGMPEDRIKELEERIVKRITNELLKNVLSGVKGDTSLSLSTSTEESTHKSTEDKIDDEVTSAALGYFDDWSDDDDE